jgi:hypothetical protein
MWSPTSLRTDTGATSASTAIQSAIVAAEPTGVPVYIPPGDYKITATLTLSKPGQVVFGAGWKSRLFFAAATNLYMFTFGMANGVRADGLMLRDLQLDCDGPNQTAGGGIQAGGASVLQVREPARLRAWGNGIESTTTTSAVRPPRLRPDCWFNRAAASNGGRAAPSTCGTRREHDRQQRVEACGSSLTNGAAVWAPAPSRTSATTARADPNTAGVEQVLVSGDCRIIGNTFDGGTKRRLHGWLDSDSLPRPAPRRFQRGRPAA